MDESTTSSAGVATTTKEQQKMVTQQSTQLSTTTCNNTILPLIASSPHSLEFKACWPKLFFLPSYPTSGNGMIRTMFMRLTRIQRTSVYEERGKLLMKLDKKKKHQPFNIYYNDIEDPIVPHPIIPYGEYPTLTKTHFPKIKGNNPVDFGYYSNTQAQINGTMLGFTSGIVRVVRNPGDHLLRDNTRWIQDCINFKGLITSSTEKEKCFTQHARQYCDVQGALGSSLSKWLKFHRFWIDKFNSSIPQMVIHYESVTSTDPAVVYKEFQDLLEFVGATYTTGDENKGASMEETLGDYIRPPEYEQGTLFAKICGVEKARELHTETQHITEKNGYIFDHDTGYWSVRERNGAI